ncbi:MAG: TlpA family protein disulfide reductase [Chitinophagaceae bacterium]|nr:TlpA family protein disulfide reductase [Chitinophagaceae bacterium]
MKILSLLIVQLCLIAACTAQTPAEIIAQVKEAQKNISNIYCKAERHDTLVMGVVRTFSGEAKISVLPEDTIFGFRFYAKRDDVHAESIYDGSAAFYIDHDSKQFNRYGSAQMIPAILGYPGGQLIFPELMKLDTVNASGFELKQDAANYYLKILLPDIDKYDVRKRYKLLTIDKKLMLPTAISMRQVTLDKVQNLIYRIKEIRVNDAADLYDFSSQRYPEDYKPEENPVNKKLLALNGKQFPSFQIISFDGKPVNSEGLKGKLVLLDFWEVWCGACVVSLPKVQALYEKYKSKGFEVYGITHEKRNLETAKELLRKTKLSFPIMLGNAKMKNDYSVGAVPLYVLIDRSGKILMTSEGYPDNMEEYIRKYLE